MAFLRDMGCIPKRKEVGGDGDRSADGIRQLHAIPW